MGYSQIIEGRLLFIAVVKSSRAVGGNLLLVGGIGLVKKRIIYTNLRLYSSITFKRSIN